MLNADKGEGVQKSETSADVICVWSLGILDHGGPPLGVVLGLDQTALAVPGDVLGGAAVGLPVFPEAVGAVGAAVNGVAPRAVELGALSEVVAVQAVLD